MKPRYKIDYIALRDYLCALDRSEIETTFQKPENAALHEATTRLSIDEYAIGNPIGPIVEYGEPFLVDALGNDLSIVVLTKRRYKLPGGRAINGIFDRAIIDNCRSVYGNPLNGIWKIPSQFLTAIGGAAK